MISCPFDSSFWGPCLCPSSSPSWHLSVQGNCPQRVSQIDFPKHQLHRLVLNVQRVGYSDTHSNDEISQIRYDKIMRHNETWWDEETPPKHLWVGVIIIIVVVIVVALIWRDRVLPWESVENPEAILKTSICWLRDGPSMVFILNVSMWRISKEQPTTGLCNSLSSWTCGFSSTNYSATSIFSFQSFWLVTHSDHSGMQNTFKALHEFGLWKKDGHVSMSKCFIAIGRKEVIGEHVGSLHPFSILGEVFPFPFA